MIETFLDLLRSLCYHLYVAETTSTFAEKHTLALVRFDQRYVAVRPKDRHGKAGEASAGSYVDDSKSTRREVRPQKK